MTSAGTAVETADKQSQARNPCAGPFAGAQGLVGAWIHTFSTLSLLFPSSIEKPKGGAGDMTSWVKTLLCKLEGLSLDL